MALQTLPIAILMEILLKLPLETLCSVACVSKSIRFAVSETLPHLPSLHLSAALSPDALILMKRMLDRCRGISDLTVNCLRLDDSSIANFLGPHLRELNLFCCSLLSYEFLASLGQRCPNLRVVVIELAAQDSSEVFNRNLAEMLTRCLFIDSLSLKIRGADTEANSFRAVGRFLHKTTKTLKLQSLLCQDAILIINELRDSANSSVTPESPLSSGLMLQNLSLSLDVISDELIMAIVNSLPLLVELHLEDMPNQDLLLHHDLTSRGLHALSTCRNLIGLSLVRGRQNHQVSFRKLNDMGMFLLSEGCKALESVRLCGFSKVSDAGFASVLHSCSKLQRFEVRNAPLLSDLAFHGINGFECPLQDLRLISCSLITSETVKQLSCSARLELLDLCGCKSISDYCLGSISSLHHLSSLNLTATDVTDYGLSLMSQGNPPISRLSLRSCKRVTDEGIIWLFHGQIGKTLSALDLGHMPGVSDRAIQVIALAGVGIAELCIRSCFHVTDSSVEALATKKRLQEGGEFLRRLDLFNCIGLSVGACRSFRENLFPGLQWLGLGNTRLMSKGNAVDLSEICSKRPWLTLCLEGCEVGCLDGWQFHRAL